MSGASSRIPQLQAMLSRTPEDPFLHYAIALEHRKAGDEQAAVRSLEKTIALDGGYCYAYYQLGQAHEAMGDPGAARRAYQAGLVASRAKGDEKAVGEIASALDLLPST